MLERLLPSTRSVTFLPAKFWEAYYLKILDASLIGGGIFGTLIVLFLFFSILTWMNQGGKADEAVRGAARVELCCSEMHQQ